MRKIRKLIKNPNMFFFDLFQKRLVNGTVQDAPRPSARSGKTGKAVTAAKPSAKEKSPANSVAETAKVPPQEKSLGGGVGGQECLDRQ